MSTILSQLRTIGPQHMRLRSCPTGCKVGSCEDRLKVGQFSLFLTYCKEEHAQTTSHSYNLLFYCQSTHSLYHICKRHLYQTLCWYCHDGDSQVCHIWRFGNLGMLKIVPVEGRMLGILSLYWCCDLMTKFKFAMFCR